MTESEVPMAVMAEEGSLAAPARAPRRVRNALTYWLPLLVFLLILAVVWEVIKLLGGQVTKVDLDLLGQHIATTWRPPFRFQFATDINMPHLWDILAAFGRPVTRGGGPLIATLLDAAGFTFRVALTGFLLGSTFGLLTAIVFVYSKLLNRAFVPYVVASQTIPILAIAPMIVIWLKAGWLSIALIAAYLTFFPVTISALRGLRASTPEMLELMQSYAASPLQTLIKLRSPASLSYLFVGFKIAATASIIGTIVGELPSGISSGLGALILTFAQYYSTGPAKLWACILVVALIGIAAYLIVQAIETFVLRNYGWRAE